MTNLILLDVAPDPVTTGAAGLVLLSVVGFVLAVVIIGGVLFAMKWRNRRKVMPGTFEPATTAQANQPNQP